MSLESGLAAGVGGKGEAAPDDVGKDQQRRNNRQLVLVLRNSPSECCGRCFDEECYYHSS